MRRRPRQGILGLSAPEAFGGAGQEHDYRYRNVVHEELARVHATGVSSCFALHDDIVVPYYAALGTPEQKDRWLARLAAGELIAAIAMTEPGTGSDLRGIRTTGKKVDGGWIVNGSKTFISSGQQADLVVVVAKTDPDGGGSGVQPARGRSGDGRVQPRSQAREGRACTPRTPRSSPSPTCSSPTPTCSVTSVVASASW
ncbi:acyl-CoA dehydrogenase family protein [Aeromicrobium sp. UC242_57]|uniref:acyl-CoA dehydrogenase family protein n=1 Tax=Aeromicrobium sp. UC242_57 TaxID=3374624 RepID=UPI00379496CD